MTRRNVPPGDRANHAVMTGIRAGYGAMQTLMQVYRPDTTIYLVAENMRRRMATIADLYVGRRDVLLAPGHSTKGVRPTTRQGKNGASDT